MLAERLLATVLSELFSREWLSSLMKCVRKWMCEDGVRVSGGDLGMMLVKLGLILGEFRFSLDACDGSLNVLRV